MQSIKQAKPYISILGAMLLVLLLTACDSDIIPINCPACGNPMTQILAGDAFGNDYGGWQCMHCGGVDMDAPLEWGDPDSSADFGELGVVITSAYELLQRPMTIYGFTFSFFSVLIWICAIGIILWVIRKVFTE